MFMNVDVYLNDLASRQVSLPGANWSSSGICGGLLQLLGIQPKWPGLLEWSMHAREVLHGKNITMVTSGSLRGIQLCCSLKAKWGHAPGKPDTLCHTKRVRREAKGFSQMRTNPRFILILFFFPRWSKRHRGIIAKSEGIPATLEIQSDWFAVSLAGSLAAHMEGFSGAWTSCSSMGSPASWALHTWGLMASSRASLRLQGL